MDEKDGLLFAYILDGKGGGKQIDWNGIQAWKPDDGVLWVHMDRTGERAKDWITGSAGIDPATSETLLMPTANRPRVQRIDDGLLVIMRGVNLNPGDQPDDMVGLHLLIDSNRILTLRRRRLMAGTEIRDLIVAGRGPKDSSDFLSEIADLLLQPMVPLVNDLDDKVDNLQIELLNRTNTELRRSLQNIRQHAINYRRYLAPQRDAMSRFQTEHVPWLKDLDRAYLRESADRTLRFVEDLDSIRERAAIAQDELNNRLSDQMNRTMYLLTVVSAILLPPSLLTGLFGINVAGMPGTDTSWSFAAIAILIPVLGAVEFVILRRLRLI
jgi:zinc transporter